MDKRRFTDAELEALLNSDSLTEIFNTLGDQDKNMLTLLGLTSGDRLKAYEVFTLHYTILRQQLNDPKIDIYRVAIKYSDDLTLLILFSLLTYETIERIKLHAIEAAKNSNFPRRQKLVDLLLREYSARS